MRLYAIALFATLVVGTNADAGTQSCPDLAAAVQVGACPTEDELRYTFNGYCSDNARLYGKDAVDCASYQSYRRLKNIALWESGDGAYQAYIACEPPVVSLKGQTAARIEVVKQGKIARVVCRYGEGIAFSYRTRANCKVVGDGNCGADPSTCKAVCDE